MHKAFENEPVVSPAHEFTLDNWEELVVFINQVVGEVSSKSGTQDDAQVSAQVNAQVNAQVSAQVNSILNAKGINTEKTVKVLKSIELLPLTRQDILSQLGLSNHYKNYDAYISPLRELGLLVYTIPDNTKSRKQQYKISLKGLILLKILNVQLPDKS